eukprot:6536681-Lingulodinium_polyedra.AAC.1
MPAGDGPAVAVATSSSSSSRFVAASVGHESYDALVLPFGLQLMPGWNYDASEGRPLGYIRVIPSGS